MTHSLKHTLLRVGVAVSFAGMVLMNYLAVALPLNGKSTGQLSDMYPNLFTPAGITFSIWSVIYLWLAAYVLYRLGLFGGAVHGESERAVHRIDGLFILNAVLNVAWILTWHYLLMWFSLLIMVLLLVSLIAITRILHRGELTKKDRAFVLLPFSIYFGWITVATIANVSAALVSIKWDGFGIAETTWTIIVLLVGLAIGLATTLRDRCVAYGLVLVWAYTGILIKHLSANGFAGAYPGIIWTVSACIGAFVLAVAYVGVRRLSRKPSPAHAPQHR